VATNGLHHAFPGDAQAHEVLLCVQTGKALADPGRFRFDGTDFYVKSGQEMRAVWAELPQACDSTLEIAERCDVQLAEGRDPLPRCPVPAGETEESWPTSMGSSS
jgi:DNA polymerase III subunit alpha